MNSQFLTTKEVAELLRIKERKVYDMAAEQLIPCTRATGKLLFSRVAIDQWLASHSTGVDASNSNVPMLFCGSHDPLLEWAIRESQCCIPTLFDGSVDGLQRVLSGQATVTAMHIYSAEHSQWNIPSVSSGIQEAPVDPSVVLLSWVVRKRGLIMRPGIALSSFKDIRGYSVAMRQATAGSHLLLEQLLANDGLSAGSLDIALTARSEADVALAIAQGKADCGLGLESLALQHQLKFLPLVDESFDLLVERKFWFEPPMQRFINFCQSSTFDNKLNDLPGYSTDHLFDVRLNN